MGMGGGGFETKETRMRNSCVAQVNAVWAFGFRVLVASSGQDPQGTQPTCHEFVPEETFAIPMKYSCLRLPRRAHVHVNEEVDLLNCCLFFGKDFFRRYVFLWKIEEATRTFSLGGVYVLQWSVGWRLCPMPLPSIQEQNIHTLCRNDAPISKTVLLFQVQIVLGLFWTRPRRQDLVRSLGLREDPET